MQLRKLLVGATVGVATFLAAASVAYACVPFFGTGQVLGETRNSTAVVGDNTGATHRVYCSGNEPTQAADGSGGATITVVVGPGTCGTTQGQLSDRNHTVILNNATTNSDAPFTYDGATWQNGVNGTGCFFASDPPDGNITLDTAFSVPPSGSATGTYTLPSPLNRVDPASIASSICVGHPTDAISDGEGIFMPLQVTSTT